MKASGEGTSVTLDRVELQVRGSWCCEHSAIRWADGADGVLRDSAIEGKVDVLSGSSVTIEDSDLESACVEVGGGAQVTMRRNVITGCPLGYGVAIRSGTALIEGNDISAPTSDVTTGFGSTEDRIALRIGAVGSPVTVRDNVLHGSRTGLSITGSNVTVEGNRIVGNDVGLESSAALTLGTGNTICDNGVDLAIDGDPVVGDAEVCAAATAADGR